ncbi:hypothetical protein QBC44DRAFT_314667 [Cladorrhinum sp. PSN332]|nr:hypothetical protein QBC44DRAFT_314667 [Cladorrhinum sp. PSN332]
MAEFAASIVAFIQLTDCVIRVCSHVIGTAKNAPRDMMMISGEVTSLRAILSCFTDAELHPNTEHALPTLFAPTGPIQGCYESIVALEQLLPKDPSDTSAIKRLTWALKEGQVRKLLADISLHKSTLLLALTGDMMRDIKDIKSGVERVEQALSRGELYEVLSWLQNNCNNPSSMHLSTYKNHEPHTNSWLDRWDAWNAWVDSTPDYIPPHRFIWIYGIPGAGKSVMASFIIERVKVHCDKTRYMYGTDDRSQHSQRDLGYSYYYCHYSHNSNSHNNNNEDTAYSYLRWTINQLCRQIMWAPQQLERLHENGCDPSIPDILDVLSQIINKFNVVYLVADGIDESDSRSELLAVFKRIVTEKRFQKVRLLVTSRPSLDIEKAFSGVSVNISMSNEFVQQDIQSVVDGWLLTSPRMQRWSHLATHIRERLCAGAQGMFRYAACQMQILERVREESQLYEALKNLPRDLDEIYTRELDRIPANDRLFVRRALIWILGHMESPWMTEQGINIELLVDAVCDDLRHLTGKSWFYTAEDLKELCGCLITTEQELLNHTELFARVRFGAAQSEAQSGTTGCAITKGCDLFRQDVCKTVPTGEFVRIAHFTVLEFLRSTRMAGTYGPAAQYFFLDHGQVTTEFVDSVLRQALAVNCITGLVDWVRDRETYCLTLAPAIPISREIADNDDNPVLRSLISYFQPTGQHVPSVRLIQTHTLTGRDANSDSFMITRLPFHHPEVPASVYARNDPNVWAILGMITTYNYPLARSFLRILGWDYKTLAEKEVVASFLEPTQPNDNANMGEAECNEVDGCDHEERLVAEVWTYHGTLHEILRIRKCFLSDLQDELGV